MKALLFLAALAAFCCAAFSKTSPPKVEVYSRDPGQYGKDNTLICHVSNFHPPDITIELLKDDRPEPSTPARSPTAAWPNITLMSPTCNRHGGRPRLTPAVLDRSTASSSLQSKHLFPHFTLTNITSGFQVVVSLQITLYDFRG
ncbi:hypothetical protein OJAV_G00219640 [Oryzias javanicus]|uniref:Immunoglobulin C1-set domain-containing protein n=1 Tax=Oryzias javanicus TaxID=123683 RepID=A0A437C0N8_ORYJA|nr:hypothetical protein OJAV_G00219640 [Oryzias javanicus]